MGQNRILVTGASGFLGRHTLPLLQSKYGKDSVFGVSSKDYDLMRPDSVDQMFRDLRPNIVVHLAAYSGGIGANTSFPADFYYRNTLLTALTFQSAAEHGVSKLVYPIGGCSYPAKAKSPIDEEQLWTGFPQTESAAYSTAKLMGTVASVAYKKQHDMNTVVIIPGNMYGEFDNFDSMNSHVIPAMIRRYHEAKENGDESVVMWGSGQPQRDFVYVGDVAQAIPFFIEEYDRSDPVNISTGTCVSIRELAETVSEVSGFSGNIVWDKTKPDGQMIKIFDTNRMKNLGISCDTPLKEGLSRTISWFSNAYANKHNTIRL